MTARVPLIALALVLLPSGLMAQPSEMAQDNQGIPRTESIPDSEKLEKSTEYLGLMRGQLKAVLSKLEEARSTKDVLKLNCVNEKLTNIKGLLRISEQADVSLQEAVAKREAQTAEHEYTKLTIARQKIDQLRAEAEQCVGMLAFETGPTEVIVEVPTNLGEGEASNLPEETAPVTRPPAASPTN